MRKFVLLTAIALAAPVYGQTVKAGIEAWGRANYAAALAAWRPLAVKGNADAMFNLGQAYRLGRGVPIDLARAQDWYDRAAHAGHVDAQTQLGILLFQTGNRGAGLRWLRAAADKGDARAQLLYGTALFNGDGIARDPLSAYRYVSKSAAQGLVPARTTLAQLDEAMSPDLRAQAMRSAAPPSVAVVGKRVSVAKAAKAAGVTSTPLPPPPPATAGSWRIQLGAFSQRSGAEALFRKFGAGPLAGRQSFLISVGSVTRLQAGPFASRAETAAVCSALIARGQPCFTVPPAR